MRKISLLFILTLTVACNVLDQPERSEIVYPAEVFASIDYETTSPETKVYADENLKVLWDNDDRITLFNKYTYNKEYRFTGSTGANSGVFTEVSSGEIVVGNALDNVYAVYPYEGLTEISNSGVIALNLPAEQHYKENSFGRGANTMVSATTNTELLFKNLCGYLILKLYGDGVSVSSISIQGNNGEVLAGKADVTATVGSTPTLSFRGNGTSTTLTLTCETPVTLGTSSTDATVFWLVVPPITFTQGFTLTVTDSDNNAFTKSTSNSTTISRNSTYRMAALEVEMSSNPQVQNIVFANDWVKSQLVSSFDANGDGEISTAEAAGVTSIGTLLRYHDNEEYTFDEFQYFTGVESLDAYAFQRNTMLSIVLPNSLTRINDYAFSTSKRRIRITVPPSLSSIGSNAFSNSTTACDVYLSDLSAWCQVSFGSATYGNPLSAGLINNSNSRGNLYLNGELISSLTIPNNITSILPYCFAGSTITELHLHESVESIGNSAFSNTLLQSIGFNAGLMSIGQQAFSSCKSLTSVDLPSSVSSIGMMAFYNCTSLTSITIRATTPPTGGTMMFESTNNCPIYVPAESVENYKTASNWSSYSDRIRAIE